VIANAKAFASALSELDWRVVSGGTDNHLLLVDVYARGVTGKIAEKALERAAITVNKNTIPFDSQPPLVASGVRFGTPALTTRGMGEAEMKTIAGFVDRVLSNPESEEVANEVRAEVETLCDRFPLYGAWSSGANG
jgi:glycine hydroxymethyltransferase